MTALYSPEPSGRFRSRRPRKDVAQEPRELRPCHRLAKLAALEEASFIDAEGDTPTIVDDIAQGESRVYRGGVLVATFVGVTSEPPVIETAMHMFREELRRFAVELGGEVGE